MFCTKCGTQNDNTATFCNQCGTNLSGYADSPAQSTPPHMPGYGQVPTAFGNDQPSSTPAYSQAMPTPSYDQPTSASGFVQPPPTYGYEQPPPEPNYGQPPPMPGYGQPHPQGKNTKKIALAVGGAVIAIAAVVVVLIFVLGGGSLSGTYISGFGGVELIFSGSNFTARSDYGDDIRGTFTLEDGRLVLTPNDNDYDKIFGYYDSSRDTVELEGILFYKRGSAAECDPRVVSQNDSIDGILRQANIAADQADVRAVMMAGSVVAMQQTPPRAPEPGDDTARAIISEFTGGVNVQPGQYTLFFDGAVAVGANLIAAHSRTGELTEVGLTGNFDVSRYTVVPILINANGTATAGTPYIPR